MFRRLQNNITCFFCKKHFYKQHQKDLILKNNNLRYQKEFKHKLRALLFQNPYVTRALSKHQTICLTDLKT